jgi:hypothetical protein
MARTLLNSEIAILLEAGASTRRDILASQQVLHEYHAPPRLNRQRWFNTDFLIELQDWNNRDRSKGKCIPIRPWSLAGTFHVSLTSDGDPTTLELLDGESLPQSSFRDEIRQVETAVKSFSRHVPRMISVSKSPYLRVARLEHCVLFLVASTTEVFDLLCQPSMPVNADHHLISYRVFNNDLLIDGVIFDSAPGGQ